ncbi:MAG: hypothetical protein S4CHLAM102_02330 [Chlamydiia bacterium]|nr:hypothetical protein [Chlamydiia bacterium]
MKTPISFCCLLLLVGSVQVVGSEKSPVVENASAMSKTELNAAFISAVKENRIDRVQELLEAGADVHTPIPYTWTAGDCDWEIESSALIYAVRGNRPDMVKALLAKDKALSSALDEAISEGYSAVVNVLISEGADINYVNADKDTPLLQAIGCARATAEFSRQAQAQARSRWSQRREIIQSLLKAGADINHVNKYGRTALMIAIKEHDLYTVQQLIELFKKDRTAHSGRETTMINLADQDGNTALMYAIKNVRTSYTNDPEYKICLSTQTILASFLDVPELDFHHVNKNGETAITLLEDLNRQLGL